MNNGRPNPRDPQWTDDRLLHEIVWAIERQGLPVASPDEWARFVRKVWAMRDAGEVRE
jgi:hypothetical protein